MTALILEHKETNSQHVLAEIITGLQEMCYAIAAKYKRRGDVDDLASAGFMSVWVKIDQYDPKIARFSTYANTLITGGILHHIRDKGSIIKIPAWIHTKLSKLERAIIKLSESGKLNVDLLAEELMITTEEVVTLLEYRQTKNTDSIERMNESYAEYSPDNSYQHDRIDLERTNQAGLDGKPLSALSELDEERLESLRLIKDRVIANTISTSSIATILDVPRAKVPLIRKLLVEAEWL
jgi:RNA polymerase sigma factor (sigma-70 family)